MSIFVWRRGFSFESLTGFVKNLQFIPVRHGTLFTIACSPTFGKQGANSKGAFLKKLKLLRPELEI